MNRIDRLFGMTTLLQARRYTSAEQLAEQFGISVRTVYRDIKALGEQGIPVSFEVGRGYFLVQGYFLPPVSFTPDEANALLLLETLGATLADGSIQPHVTAALQKVRAVLRPADQDRLAELASRIMLHVPEYAESHTAHLATIQAAIANGRVLEVDYQDKNGGSTRRRVEPIGLVFYNFTWHFIGWCQLRQAYRDFRVSRVQHLMATTLPFAHSPQLTLANYLATLGLPRTT
jgi:predicted DNA-binding transcriptional regulator YafY